MSENTIFHKNMQVLQKYNATIAQKMHEKSTDEEIQAGVEEIAGRSVLYGIREGKQYQLDSLYDSTYMVNTWYQKVTADTLRYRSRFFLFGLGNGMYAKKALAETSEDVLIFIYEPSKSIWKTVLEKIDISNILCSDRIILQVADYGDLLLEEKLDRVIRYEEVKGYIISKYPNYSRLYPKEAKRYVELIQIYCNRRDAERFLLERHGVAYYCNTFQNLHFLRDARSLRSLWEKIPKGIPAIVVSSGPSLDKNIEELKKAVGKSFLIAADSALKALLAHDIIPDMFVSVDGLKNPAHFQDERIQNIPLACNLQSNLDMMQFHKGMKYYTKSLDFYLQDKLEQMGVELPVFGSGGSVAHECFELARILECNPIILVGQDLAYTNAQTHASHTVRGEWHIDVQNLDTLTLEGIDGAPVLSSYEFQLYLQWFEQQIEKNPQLRVIDATEGGARIHGTRIECLADTIARECVEAVPMGALLQETMPMMTEAQYQELKRFIRNIPEELENALRIAKEMERCYQRMLFLIYQDKYQKNEFKQLYGKIIEMSAKLEAIGAMEYVQSHIQQITNQTMEGIYDVQADERAELIAGCKVGSEYSKAIIGGIETVLPDIAKRVEIE